MNISIVTITFNNYDDLLKTLQSTDNLGCERIVINGGSCQKTKDFLESRKDIISVSEPDEGIADAFNKGIRLSQGNGIWFLNSGDVCIDEKYMSFANAHISNYNFIYSDIIFNSLLYGNLKIKPQPKRTLGSGMPYPHSGMIFNKSVFEKIGLFNINFKIAMDFELICRMKKANLKGLYYPHETVLMDGAGVSNTHPYKALEEDKRALDINGLLDTINFLAIKKREIKLKALSFTDSIGILKFYRKLKKLFIS